MALKSVTFFVSHECDASLSVKIIGLEGRNAYLKQSQKYTEPELSKKASNFIPNSDMFVSLQVFDSESGRHLTIPVYTRYVPFKNGRVWNQWLTLPIKINQLDMSSTLLLEIWEYNGDSRSTFGWLETPIFNSHDYTLKRGREVFKFSKDEENRVLAVKDQNIDLINDYDTGELKSSQWLDSAVFSALEERVKDEKLPIGSFKFTIQHKITRVPIVYTSSEVSNPQISIPTFHNLERNEVHDNGNKSEPEVKISLGKSHDSTLFFYDPDQYNTDLIEEKFRRLERSSRETDTEKYVKPDAKKRDILNSIIASPPGTKLTDHEKGLIWKYRYYLSNNKKALTKLLQSTNLSEESEIKEVLDLMDVWAEIDLDDTMELLGPQYTNISVRSYAVNRLRNASDNELELYLLQLVQSVCFECTSTLSDKSNSEFTIVDIEHTNNEQGHSGDIADASQCLSNSFDRNSVMISPLAEFLIRRAVKNFRLGNFFYWYLRSESERNTFLIHILESFRSRLPEQYRNTIDDQILLVSMLRKFCEEIKQSKETTVKKQEILLHLISTRMRPLFKSKTITLPLDPDVVAVDVIPSSCKVFKSSLSPLKVTFLTADNQHYSFMFKVGDDLIQDQLVVQIIKLMDQLLKNENVDLKLTPYNILATGKNEGAIEFIPNETMGSTLSVHHGILKYFQQCYPSESEIDGVEPWVMDNFVKSCAGYCVITYILGVGDRHLDNLLIQPDGRFFHADFGYILGYDPKPFPPLMKLPPQIIEAFGGTDSANYDKFRSYCFVAYSILRRNAGLIINLFELMKTSDIPNIKMDPEGAVLKVMEKFAFDLSEEDATVHFQNLITTSVNALIPLVIDHLHNLAQYWRV
ncbi:unnamed protein product [Kluyveromyces dobzhanskii CBS 2104]|uniref:Phosphatidylinositol 3-kinase VPS34 n=1 Tax=Kluyveromyces dobzhanskii CBS 2104 TaxID=1427455 RepID=A0A0A8L733_9SACH|nr:unnamed protein product [Kluyveromyces dobzhanskii CBS 2104]